MRRQLPIGQPVCRGLVDAHGDTVIQQHVESPLGGARSGLHRPCQRGESKLAGRAQRERFIHRQIR